MKRFLLSITLLMGAVIGAGIFSLPFVFYKAGILAGFFYLILGALVFTTLHLMYGEVILHTPGGEHRFVGYTRIYLGERAALFSICSTVIASFCVLAIYLALATSFSAFIIPAAYLWWFFFLFWITGTLAIFLSMARLALTEFLVNFGIIVIIVVIFILGFGAIAGRGLSVPLFNASNIFSPIGTIMFALSGFVAVPSVIQYLRKLHTETHRVARTARIAFIIGTWVPAMAYGLFALGVLGLSRIPSQDAISGLIGNVGPFIIQVMGVLGILSLWSSYVLVGLDVKNTIIRDLKLSQFLSALLVVAAPPAIYFMSSENFIGLMSFVGGVFLAIDGLLMVWIWRRCEKRGIGDRLIRHGRSCIPWLLCIALFGVLISTLIK